MARGTIDYGIDLGTTNSVISVLNGSDPEVIENQEGSKCTPSAVWIDPKGALHVGKKARERAWRDQGNARAEFKIRMGSADVYNFVDGKRTMTPQQLSAEVLKRLCADAQSRTQEQVRAAVVTIPAVFEDPQMAATRQAAEMAGLSPHPLLIEPIAAAQAYGFQTESDRAFWLVFDFGGGTFDAALIGMRDGQIEIVNHGGDLYLGGKILDWNIVDQLLVPALVEEYQLAEFNRGNPKWAAAFGKLKEKAEEAKIDCSTQPHSIINLDPLCQDDRGEWVIFEYELSASGVADLMMPLIERALNHCTKVLEDARLGAGDVEKVLMVGGSTMSPFLREVVKDRLGVPLEFSIDPLTVVARGAAIVARGHVVDSRPGDVPAGTHAVKLDYKPVDADPEPLIGGQVVPPAGASVVGCTIEFVNTRDQWRSGQVPVSDSGNFATVLKAEQGRENVFRIELRQGGNLLPVSPETFPIIVKPGDVLPTALHSLGVALASNEMAVFLAKGSDLPASKTNTDDLRTSRPLMMGLSGDALRIPVLQGENIRRASRNSPVGVLKIPADKIARDVPEGSDIHITITANADQKVSISAYLPCLDDYFEEAYKIEIAEDNVDALAAEVKTERSRLEQARKDLAASPDAKAGEAMSRLDREHMVEEIEQALTAARGGDTEALTRGRSRLRDFQSALDDVDDALAWPKLVAEARAALADCRSTVQDLGTDEDGARFKALEHETEQAIAAHDTDILARKLQETHGLNYVVKADCFQVWVNTLNALKARKAFLTDQAKASALFTQGDTAVERKDKKGLQTVCEGLFALEPIPDGPQKPTDTGDIVRKQ